MAVDAAGQAVLAPADPFNDGFIALVLEVFHVVADDVRRRLDAGVEAGGLGAGNHRAVADGGRRQQRQNGAAEQAADTLGTA